MNEGKPGPFGLSEDQIDEMRRESGVKEFDPVQTRGGMAAAANQWPDTEGYGVDNNGQFLDKNDNPDDAIQRSYEYLANQAINEEKAVIQEQINKAFDELEAKLKRIAAQQSLRSSNAEVQNGAETVQGAVVENAPEAQADSPVLNRENMADVSAAPLTENKQYFTASDGTVWGSQEDAINYQKAINE